MPSDELVEDEVIIQLLWFELTTLRRFVRRREEYQQFKIFFDVCEFVILTGPDINYATRADLIRFSTDTNRSSAPYNVVNFVFAMRTLQIDHSSSQFVQTNAEPFFGEKL